MDLLFNTLCFKKKKKKKNQYLLVNTLECALYSLYKKWQWCWSHPEPIALIAVDGGWSASGTFQKRKITIKLCSPSEVFFFFFFFFLRSGLFSVFWRCLSYFFLGFIGPFSAAPNPQLGLGWCLSATNLWGYAQPFRTGFSWAISP